MDATKPCTACTSPIPTAARKCPTCRARQPGMPTFQRQREGKLLGGVCTGLGRELGVDPTWLRVGLAILALGSVGLAFWGYVVLWLVTPLEGSAAPAARLLQTVRGLFGSPSAVRAIDPPRES